MKHIRLRLYFCISREKHSHIRTQPGQPTKQQQKNGTKLKFQFIYKKKEQNSEDRIHKYHLFAFVVIVGVTHVNRQYIARNWEFFSAAQKKFVQNAIYSKCTSNNIDHHIIIITTILCVFLIFYFYCC